MQSPCCFLSVSLFKHRKKGPAPGKITPWALADRSCLRGVTEREEGCISSKLGRGYRAERYMSGANALKIGVHQGLFYCRGGLLFLNSYHETGDKPHVQICKVRDS